MATREREPHHPGAGVASGTCYGGDRNGHFAVHTHHSILFADAYFIGFTRFRLDSRGATARATEGGARAVQPTADEIGQIQAKMAELGALLGKLERNPLYADVAIYRKAGEFILKLPEEFATPAYVKDTLTVLDHGIARAKELAAARPRGPGARAA